MSKVRELFPLVMGGRSCRGCTHRIAAPYRYATNSRMRPDSYGASNERKRVELSSEVPPASVNEERVLRGNLVCPEKCDRDHPAGRWGPRAARHLANLSGPFRDLVAVNRRDIGVDSQAEELAAHLAHVRPARHDLLPDVASLREAEGESRSDLESDRIFAHLHAEPRGAGLDSKDLERVAADRRHAPSREGVPDFSQAGSGGPDRVAGFPQPAHPANVALVMLVDGKGEERVLSESPHVHGKDAGHEIPRGQPVHLDLSARAEVMELDIIADAGLFEDRQDRVLLRRLDVQDERVRERVDPKVPEHAALL